MEIVTVADIKQNSRIDSSDEDTLLADIADTAEAMVEAAMNRTWADITMTYGSTPAPLKRAVLMVADHLYQHRGATSNVAVNVIPFGASAMIKPYTILR